MTMDYEMVCSFSNLEDWLKAMLDKRAEQDTLFAVTYKKENKSIAECGRYIIQEMRELASKNKQGNVGFVGGNDEDLIGLAVHYYDEDSIKVKKEKATPTKPAAKPKPAVTDLPLFNTTAKPTHKVVTKNDGFVGSLF